jgi:trigger factor
MNESSTAFDYSSTIEEIDEVTKSIRIAVPASLFEERVRINIRRVRNSAKVNGFRPGKAPLDLIERIHGDAARAEVVQKLMSESLYRVLTEAEIPLVGEPEITIEQFEDGKDFSFVAIVAIMPSPDVTGYEDISVAVDAPELLDSAVDERIQDLIARRGKLVQITDRSHVIQNDIVQGKISCTVVETGQDFAPEPITFRLGVNHLPKSVEDRIIGSSVGMVIDEVGVFPEESPTKSLIGKETRVKFELESIHSWELPVLTDELVTEVCKDLKVDGINTVQAFRERVVELMRKDLENEHENAVNAAILKQLCQCNQFLIPQILLDNEIRSMLIRVGVLDPSRYDVSEIDVSKYRERLNEIADERVRSTIIIDAIVKKKGKEVSEQEKAEAIRNIALTGNQSEEEVIKKLRKQEIYNNFTRELLRDKLIKELRDKATITLLPKSEKREQLEGL